MRICTFLIILFMTTGPLWAQSFQKQKATQLAQRLSQSAELPENVKLRFEVLAWQLESLNSRDTDNLLGFFSDTRIMVWNQQVDPQTEQTMSSFEEQMQQLAASDNRYLDLPPVGYSPRGPQRLLTNEKSTAEGLSQLTLNTERIATEMLSSHNSPALLSLRDNLTDLREDLANNSVSPNSARRVIGSWTRLVSQDATVLDTDQRLEANLERLLTSLRGTIPLQALENPTDVEVSIVE